jgi:hypothetical protein
MAFLFGIASLFFIVGVLWTKRATAHSNEAVFQYAHRNFGPQLAARFPAENAQDRHFHAFLRSPETFDDTELAHLKAKALRASRVGMWPLLAIVALMAFVYVYASILGLIRAA